MTSIVTRSIATLAIGMSALTAGAVQAQDSVSEFYAGQTINLIVGYSPGGTYDISSRLVANHLGDFIPGNPEVIVQNMPGGSFALANQFVDDPAMQDGLTIAVMPRALPQLAIQGYQELDFDPTELSWLGSLSSYAEDAYLLLVNADHEAQTADDLFDPEIETVLGGGNAGSTNQQFAIIARDVLGLNVDVVTGYSGAAPIFLAMEQGEVDGQVIGYASSNTGQPDLWANDLVRPLIQFGRTDRMDVLPDVPTARELVEDPETLALLEFAELPFFMAMPYATGADVPQERLAALQEGFMEMVNDPDFQAETDELGLERSPVDGAGIVDLLERAAATPAETIESYNAIMGVE